MIITVAPGGPPQMPAAATFGLSGHTCPECGNRFPMAAPRQIFCSTRHKRAWEKRASRRGAQLLPFAMTARATRDGTRGDKATGAHASADANILMQRWKDEDSAEGRMSQVDYVALRYRLGFDRP